MGLTNDNATGQPIWYRAIHRKVLAVYIESGSGESSAWAAYLIPVKGENYSKEAQDWRTEGAELSEDEARAICGAIAEDFDNRGLKYIS
jgi:hypothetical protein